MNSLPETFPPFRDYETGYHHLSDRMHLSHIYHNLGLQHEKGQSSETFARKLFLNLSRGS